MDNSKNEIENINIKEVRNTYNFISIEKEHRSGEEKEISEKISQKLACYFTKISSKLN